MSEPTRKPPVRCVKCGDTGVILSRPVDESTKRPRWRYRCLGADCAVAWWVDEHEYWRNNPPER
ncbi:hypothetical protein [Streptomyces sp. NPDC088752]|uniref:hypothetical protein n=1 Tax=Streptomyces sp. NPDC088752 TaxID=3154963 RepID=UPI00341E4EB1